MGKNKRNRNKNKIRKGPYIKPDPIIEDKIIDNTPTFFYPLPFTEEVFNKCISEREQEILNDLENVRELRKIIEEQIEKDGKG